MSQVRILKGLRPLGISRAVFVQQAVLTPVAQILPLSGADGPPSWRRWDFWEATCTANPCSTPYSGAGPHPFSPSAPGMAGTCAVTLEGE